MCKKNNQTYLNNFARFFMFLLKQVAKSYKMAFYLISFGIDMWQDITVATIWTCFGKHTSRAGKLPPW